MVLLSHCQGLQFNALSAVKYGLPLPIVHIRRCQIIQRLVRVARDCSYSRTYQPSFQARSVDSNFQQNRVLHGSMPSINLALCLWMVRPTSGMHHIIVLQILCDLTCSWLKKYNEERPRDALGDLFPLEYLAVKQGPEVSSYAWY